MTLFEAGLCLVVIPQVMAVGFCALPRKSRALAEDFSTSVASALQAAPGCQDSVQNLLICCMCCFSVGFFFNRCEYINFPGFPALYSSSTQKQELEIQQNALWSTGPSVCLGGTYLIPSWKLQARNNMPGMWCLPDIPACTGITQCQNYSYSASLCFLSTNCQTCVFFPGYRGYGIGTGGSVCTSAGSCCWPFSPFMPQWSTLCKDSGP